MILDIDRVFSAEELAVVRGQEAGKQEHGKKEAGQRPVEKQTAVEQLVGAAA